MRASPRRSDGARALVVVLASLAASVSSAHAATNLDAVREATPTCAPARAFCFSIALHIAETDAGLVAPEAWVVAQLATANEHFARIDVGFELASVDALPAAAARIANRAQRSALATHLGGPVIHVFITGQLDDVDQPDTVIRGVTWRAGDRKFIIVSAIAMERVLAHELGHFFGLPHSTYPISIMNKTPREEPPHAQRTFADEELAKMRPRAQQLVRTKVLANRKRP